MSTLKSKRYIIDAHVKASMIAYRIEIGAYVSEEDMKWFKEYKSTAIQCPYDKNKDCSEKCKQAMTCIQRKEKKDGR